MKRERGEESRLNRDELYRTAVREWGRALDRLAAGYEADPDKRRDLRQEIHFQLWKSLEIFDGRCSLKTWAFRIAHNAAVSHVNRERRWSARFATLEEIERTTGMNVEPDIDRRRVLEQLTQLILKLKPLDRQIILCWLEEMETAAIAEITGLSAANIGMKIHRIKNILSRRFLEEQHYA